jgi:hypothetical protein
MEIKIMKFNSKAHMAQELISGKRFQSVSGLEICYDDRYTKPFRYCSNTMLDICDAYSLDIWEEVKSCANTRVNHGECADIELKPYWHEDSQYRIKPTTKTIYEWMYRSKGSTKWAIREILLSEEEAKRHFGRHEYRKTGRSWEVE